MKKHLLTVIWFLAIAFPGMSARAAEAVSAAELERFKSAAAYSHSQRGTGVLVMRRGETIFEDYATGWTAEKPHLLRVGEFEDFGGGGSREVGGNDGSAGTRHGVGKKWTANA